jgi:hypothetical protein
MGGQAPWKVIEKIYSIWEEQGRIDDYPTLDEALRVVDRLKREASEPNRSRYNGYLYAWLKQRNYVTMGLDAQEYLTDRKAWSPYIDDVAVRRFVNTLEWDDYQALTVREKTEAEHRLSHYPDPFDWTGSSPGARHYVNQPNGMGVPPHDATWRGKMFRTTWSLEERENMRDRVSRKRQLARQRAAA